MTTDSRKIQLETGVDASGAKAGFDEIKNSAKDMAASVAQSGEKASKAVDGIGRGAGTSAKNVSAASTTMADAVRRSTAAIEGGNGRSAAANKRASDSIDRYIKGLDVQNASLGKSTREAKLYELTQKGATAAQLAQADALLRSNEAYSKHATLLGQVKVGAALAAASLTAATIATAKHSIDLLDQLDDISEKTGITVAKLSELRFAGESTGTPFESLTTGFTKLAKNMAEAAGGSKEAIATFKALGVEVKNTDGSLRSSDAVFGELATKFAGYEDSAAKAALAQRAFGKSGGEMIPLLNQGAAGIEKLRIEASKLGAIYDGDLAKSAAGLNDNLTKIKLASEAAAVSISGPLIGALGRLSEEFLEAKKNGGLLQAGFASYFTGVKQFWNGELFTGGNAAQKALAAMSPEDSNDAVFRKFLRPPTKVAAPVVQDAPPKGAKAPKDNSAEQERKAQLASDIDAIKNTREALVAEYGNAEKILEAKRSAILLDDEAYYAQKIGFLTKGGAAEVAALEQQKSRLQQEKLTGKDAIDNAKQIADVEAQIVKARASSATSLEVLGIQQVAALKKVKDALEDARDAAQSYLETTGNAQRRELLGLGKGTQARERDALRNTTDDKYEARRQELAGDLRRGDLTRAQYDAQLGIVNEFHRKALGLDETFWTEKLEKQKDWSIGALEGLRNYNDEATNAAKHTEEAFTNALNGLEDQFTNLFSGKKFDLKKLIGDTQEDLTRNFVKENITGPLSKLAGDAIGDGGLLSGLLGSSKKGGERGASASNPLFVRLADALGLAGAASGGLGGAPTGSGGGLLGSLIGAAASAFMPAGGFSTGTALGLANASGGGLDDFLKFKDNFSGYGFANGGSPPVGKISMVGERGPELFVPRQAGTIIPNEKLLGNSREITVHYQPQPGESRKTMMQNGAELSRQLRLATNRFS